MKKIMKFTHKKYCLSIMLLGLTATTIAQNYNPWDPYQQTLQEYYQQLAAQEERAALNSLIAANLGYLSLGIGIGALSVIAYNYYKDMHNSNNNEGQAPTTSSYQ